MKKFNADGGFRKDTIKEFDEHNLNDYTGKSLKETTEALDDTVLLSEEEIKEIQSKIKDDSETIKHI